MSLERLLHMVDEFGRAMHDSGKRPGSIPPAMQNLERERLHDAIKALAAGKLDEHFASWHQLKRAMTAPPEPPPVDRNARTLTDGSPVTADHREIDPSTGQQKGYVVLSAEERAKGFVRPVRRSYVHDKCGVVTTMGQALAETYAREPGFYSGTFCVGCRAHFPVGADGEFTWDGTTEKVGT
jgi:hypothetical protein